ncbi:hypothetical protein SETIT_2G095800v2 [Setaria italica]|uniref:Uncharacterized protein n=1 Tax=Setaria italica TaxID=4555 RepID=A0A368PZ17_SETIT|nr:hypothetical protein SETIT_2G095800v2 [Setaria italica]
MFMDLCIPQSQKTPWEICVHTWDEAIRPLFCFSVFVNPDLFVILIVFVVAAAVFARLPASRFCHRFFFFFLPFFRIYFGAGEGLVAGPREVVGPARVGLVTISVLRAFRLTGGPWMDENANCGSNNYYSYLILSYLLFTYY